MKKAFIVLAHECNENLLTLLEILLRDGSYVSLHYDKTSCHGVIPAPLLDLSRNRNTFLLADQVPVIWGEWSIVRATLNAVESLSSTGAEFDYVSLLSGACSVTKPLELLDHFLEKNAGNEFIESFDGHRYRWVRSGYQIERWCCYHFINWRKHPRLFDLGISLQHFLGISRSLPANLQPKMGSQWWTLTWRTLQKVVEYSEKHRLEDYFKSTWVPDELFFQTVVPAVVDDRSAVTGASLMQYDFGFRGTPRIYYDDNFPELVASNKFFARKIASNALCLRDKLSFVASMDISSFVDYVSSEKASDPATPAIYPLPDALVSGPYQFVEPKMISGCEAGVKSTAANSVRHFVVASYCSSRLRDLRERINKSPGLVCYGNLMANSIEEVVAAKEGSSTDDAGLSTLAQRDRDWKGFLKGILSDNSSDLTGFIIHPGRDYAGKHVLMELINRPDVLVILDQGWRSMDWEKEYDDVLDLLMSLGICSQRPANSALLGQFHKSMELKRITDILEDLRHLRAELIRVNRKNCITLDTETFDNWSPSGLWGRVV